MHSSTCTCAAWRDCCVHDRSCHHEGKDGASATYSTTTADAAITAEAGSVAMNSAIGAVVAHMVEASAADSKNTGAVYSATDAGAAYPAEAGATHDMTGDVTVFSSTDLAKAGEMYLSAGQVPCMSWCDELHHRCRRCDHWPRQAKIVRQISQTNHLRHVHHSLVLAGADGGGRNGRKVREPGHGTSHLLDQQAGQVDTHVGLKTNRRALRLHKYPAM